MYSKSKKVKVVEKSKSNLHTIDGKLNSAVINRGAVRRFQQEMQTSDSISIGAAELLNGKIQEGSGVAALDKRAKMFLKKVGNAAIEVASQSKVTYVKFDHVVAALEISDMVYEGLDDIIVMFDEFEGRIPASKKKNIEDDGVFPQYPDAATHLYVSRAKVARYIKETTRGRFSSEALDFIQYMMERYCMHILKAAETLSRGVTTKGTTIKDPSKKVRISPLHISSANPIYAGWEPAPRARKSKK